MSNRTQHLQTLGLGSDATAREIAQAHRDLAYVWHPDRFENNPRLKEKAQEKLKEINVAFSFLSSDHAEIVAETRSNADEPPPAKNTGGDDHQSQAGPRTDRNGNQRPRSTEASPPVVSSFKRQALSAVGYISLFVFVGSSLLLAQNGRTIKDPGDVAWLVAWMVGALIAFISPAGRQYREEVGQQFTRNQIGFGILVYVILLVTFLATASPPLRDTPVRLPTEDGESRPLVQPSEPMQPVASVEPSVPVPAPAPAPQPESSAAQPPPELASPPDVRASAIPIRLVTIFEMSGQPAASISIDDRVVLVREGELINGLYRVMKIGATSMVVERVDGRDRTTLVVREK